MTLINMTLRIITVSLNKNIRLGWKYLEAINIIIMHADWINEWGTLWVRACFMLERERERYKEGEHSYHNFYGENEEPGSWSLSREECLECGHALCLQECVHPLHWSERGRDREKERVRKRKRELFLKGMMGALAPLSYLVFQYYAPSLKFYSAGKRVYW